MPPADLSLVMPCYNEEEVICYTIPQLFDAFERTGRRGSVSPIIGREGCVERGSVVGLADLTVSTPWIKIPAASW